MDLLGKRALVTGGSRGIGAAIAIALAEKGADVAFTYQRSADRAATVVWSIEEKGRRGLAIQADNADPEAISRAVTETVDVLGGLDILVSRVGIGTAVMTADLACAELRAIEGNQLLRVWRRWHALPRCSPDADCNADPDQPPKVNTVLKSLLRIAGKKVN